VLAIRWGSIAEMGSIASKQSKSMVWKFEGFSYEDGAAIKEEDSNLEFSIFWLF